MSFFNTPTRKMQRANVTPSSRDSISGWLDVLTSMLSLPESQRVQVRDELEDHLRSRVDDLLITGTPEPEAIRIAVAELGETAKLAKLITNAHTRANPRRRTMQTLLIAGALTGLSVGGYSFLATSPAIPAGVPSVALYTEGEMASSPDTRVIEINDQPMLMAFESIATEFNFAFEFDTLDQQMISDLQRFPLSIRGDMTFDRAIKLLLIQSLQQSSILATEINGDTIELITRDEQIRRSIETQVFYLENVSGNDLYTAIDSLQDLLRATVDTDWISIQVIGNGVVVSAPPELLVRAGKSWDLIGKLHSEAIQSDFEQEVQDEADHERAVIDLQKEFQSIRERLIKAQSEELLVREQIKQLEDEIANSDDTAEQKKNRGKQVVMTSHLNEIRLMVEELESRYLHLNQAVIESEYALLFDKLS